MEELPGCPACGAPSTVRDVNGPDASDEMVVVTCIAHHSMVGPRDLLAPKLRWDVPVQRVPMREELMFAPARACVSVHRG